MRLIPPTLTVLHVLSSFRFDCFTLKQEGKKTLITIKNVFDKRNIIELTDISRKMVKQ